MVSIGSNLYFIINLTIKQFMSIIMLQLITIKYLNVHGILCYINIGKYVVHTILLFYINSTKIIKSYQYAFEYFIVIIFIHIPI